MMDILRSMTGDVIAKSLDGHYARQEAIVSNVSNASTPNYRHRSVAFSSDLASALARARSGSHGSPSADNDTPLKMTGTQAGHFNFSPESSRLRAELSNDAYNGAEGIGDVGINSTSSEGFSYRNDGNDVDLEREMVQLAKNASKFKSLITFQSRINQQLKGVIRDSS